MGTHVTIIINAEGGGAGELQIFCIQYKDMPSYASDFISNKDTAECHCIPNLIHLNAVLNRDRSLPHNRPSQTRHHHSFSSGDSLGGSICIMYT